MKKAICWLLELYFVILFGVFVLFAIPVILLERIVRGEPDGWGRYRE